MAKFTALFIVSIFNALTLNFVLVQSASVTSDGCGTNKTCLTLPQPCEQNSCVFVSWRESATPNSIDIELLGPVREGPGHYVSIAFGTINKMQDGDVYFCGNDEMKTATMQSEHDAPLEMPAENGLISGPVGIVDGRTHCTFTRPLSVTKTISSNVEHDFDLESNSYYLLMAEGLLSDGYLEYHNWAGLSESKINFTENFASQRVTTTPSPKETMNPPMKEPQVSPETTPKPMQTESHPMKVASTPEPEAVATTTGSGNAVLMTQWLLITSLLLVLLR